MLISITIYHIRNVTLVKQVVMQMIKDWFPIMHTSVSSISRVRKYIDGFGLFLRIIYIFMSILFINLHSITAFMVSLFIGFVSGLEMYLKLIILLTCNIFYMQRGYSPSPKPAYRNTRSKFYKKKQSDISKASPAHQDHTSDYWKNKGNEAFAKGFFQTALDHYTKAIEINPGESIYYSNRAKCYRNLAMIDKALKDAETACELDDKNIKAHYLCGCILAESSKKDDSKISKAENRLKKALRLCDSLKKTEFIDSISIKLFRLRKLRYLKEEEARKQHNKQIINLIKKSYVESLIKKEEQDQLIKMEEMLNKEKKQEIPDHLLCKITLEVMEEPVTTEGGFTYEKSALEDHIKTNGMIQPITRQPMKGPMYPNQALKITIQSFMEENPWAFQHTANQSYNDIEF